MRGRWLYSAVLLASGLALPSSAQDLRKQFQQEFAPRKGLPDFPLPRLQQPCGTECADFQKAKPISNPEPEFRSDLLGNQVNFAPEGFLLLRYTVGIDGKTHDITPVITLGIPKMSAMAIEAIQGWTFTPATRGGKPVPEMFYYLKYLHAKDRIMAAIGGHSLGVAALRTTKPDEDEASAETADMDKNLAHEQMTFTARSVFALPLIGQAMERKDYFEARRLAIMATVPDDLVVGEELVEKAWGARVDADLALGETADAILALRTLKHYPGYANNPALTTPANDAIGAALQKPEMLARAVIPPQEDGPVYWHALYRNTFKFAEGSGTLDKFSLMCDQNMLEGQVSFTAQWRLPSKWRNCILFVTGTPGSTFGVIETQSPDKATN